MYVSLMHANDLGVVAPTKHWPYAPERIFRLLLWMTMKPAAKREVQQPIASIKFFCRAIRFWFVPGWRNGCLLLSGHIYQMKLVPIGMERLRLIVCQSMLWYC